jgi:aminopeptidase N
MNIFKFIVQKSMQNSMFVIVLGLLLLIANGCATKKPISRENGMALEPIIVSKNNPMLVYRATAPIDFKIMHTDINVAFNWKEHELLGTVQLHIQALPLHPIDSIMLDAKSMEIEKISLKNQVLKFNYAKNKLTVYLPKTLQYFDIDIIEIKYKAMPDKNEAKGSSAIRAAKGLYFINTDKIDVHKPTQIWTQGETESNSGWFPTVDKPNNKSTFAIHIKVPKNFVTLSNGKYTDSTFEGNDRIDTWSQSTPMSAYLVMMAIGEYSITKDAWQGKPVYYYVEPNYTADAKENFNHTPEMMQFFSDRLGIPFAWDKYSQVTARDYISGAMENTSASLFGEFVQKYHGELIDNSNDGIVAHELFHQWFGDLVTCESWSNLVLNEGFATYGEYLWTEHKYGKDDADRLGYNDLARYLQTAEGDDGPIVRFYYKERENMFSPITYKKGGRVLHLLRQELGDTIFFAGLHNYLNDFSYQTAEVHDLRKCMEKVSGKDLNLFFNQWMYRGDHPVVHIYYQRQNSNEVQVKLEQHNDSAIVFQTPIEFEFANSMHRLKKKFYLTQKVDSFVVNISELQDNYTTEMPTVFADAGHYFIGEIIEHKTIDDYANNYYLAKNSTDKLKAIATIIKYDSINAVKPKVIYAALQDDNKYVRNAMFRYIDIKKSWDRDRLKIISRDMASQDEYAGNRENALQLLGFMKDAESKKLFLNKINDSSFAVSAQAIAALNTIDSSLAYQTILPMQFNAKGAVKVAIANVFATIGNSNDSLFFEHAIATSFGNERINLLNAYTKYISGAKEKSIYQSWLNLMSHYAMLEEKETIKIAATRNLNIFYDELKAGTSKIKEVQSAIIVQEMEKVLAVVYATEKNAKAIAEYKRMGWMKN